MCNHVFIGLFLVAFQPAYYNCVPGPVFSLRDFPMDLSLEEKHTEPDRAQPFHSLRDKNNVVNNLNFLGDAQVEMAKRVTECKDERDCSWIEKELAKYGGNLEEYCQLYKDRASIKQCRKTCKVCKAPASLECKDERDCSWIEMELAKFPGTSLEEYCELYKDRTPIKQCRETCKTCKAPAPAVCQDERQDCDSLIVKTGGGVKLEEYCKKWKDDPAVKQCPATCNMCANTPSIPSRDPGVAPAVANKKLVQAARDSRANLLYNVKKLLAARRGYPQAFPKRVPFPDFP